MTIFPFSNLTHDNYILSLEKKNICYLDLKFTQFPRSTLTYSTTLYPTTSQKKKNQKKNQKKKKERKIKD